MRNRFVHSQVRHRLSRNGHRHTSTRCRFATTIVHKFACGCAPRIAIYICIRCRASVQSGTNIKSDCAITCTSVNDRIDVDTNMNSSSASHRHTPTICLCATTIVHKFACECALRIVIYICIRCRASVQIVTNINSDRNSHRHRHHMLAIAIANSPWQTYFCQTDSRHMRILAFSFQSSPTMDAVQLAHLVVQVVDHKL